MTNPIEDFEIPEDFIRDLNYKASLARSKRVFIRQRTESSPLISQKTETQTSSTISKETTPLRKSFQIQSINVQESPTLPNSTTNVHPIKISKSNPNISSISSRESREKSGMISTLIRQKTLLLREKEATERAETLAKVIHRIKSKRKKQPSKSSSNRGGTSKTHSEQNFEQFLETKTEWLKLVMKRNPELNDLYERLSPFHRTCSFAEIFSSKSNIPHNLIVQLIIQHLLCLGFRRTAAILSEESQVGYEPRHLRDSRLQSLIRVAVTDTEHVWNTTMDLLDKGEDEDEPQVDLGKHFLALGVADDDLEFPNDRYIWEEEPEPDVSLIFKEDKGLKAATLNQLVVMLTDETDFHSKYMKTFLMTYHMYISPPRLLSKLTERYHVPTRYDIDEAEFANIRNRIHIRVVNVLRTWIREHPTDFSPPLVKQLLHFIEGTLSKEGPTEQALAADIRRSIERLSDMQKIKETFHHEPPPEPKVHMSTIFSPVLSLYDIDAVEIARQITLYEHLMFRAIKASELLNQSWNKQKYKHRAPNVLAMIHGFNSLSGWVATTIMRNDKVRERQIVIEKFIKVAEHLRLLNNFNSLMAILSGLNCASVFRLKYSFEDISRRYSDSLAKLREEMNSTKGFKKYRDILAKISGQPCIPYLGIFLTDLVFTDDANPNFIEAPKPSKNGIHLMLINFLKQKLTYSTIFKIQTYQSVTYNFHPIVQILNLLDRLPRWTDSELYSKSLMYEPRNATREQIL